MKRMRRPGGRGQIEGGKKVCVCVCVCGGGGGGGGATSLCMKGEQSRAKQAEVCWEICGDQMYEHLPIAMLLGWSESC